MLTKADVFEVLSVTRRRDVVRLVQENGDVLEARDIVDQIAAAEDDVPVGEHSSKTRQSVYNTVTGTHLPKLARHDIVEYDEDLKTVRRGQHFAMLVSVLQAADAAMNSAVSPDAVEAVLRGGCDA